MAENSFNVLIGITGSVAAIKLPILIKSILDLNKKDQKYDFKVKVICTERSKHFIKENEIKDFSCLHDDAFEWSSWQGRGDPVVHIDLGKWANMMVIAPLDANSLAKISLGICDNLLTCTVRAWDMSKPLLFCPAMNTRMWNHPITSKQIATLKEWGYKEIPPINKKLMCGDTGVGAMAEVDTIVQKIKSIAEKLYESRQQN
ncbi:phosphopantothenoylcysteine decarboxylase [Melitaea cinxia]|uniref:phosphopantothenoylcysteine decarboxylase n=1 Tax=Melitaea cinxia TaxID=113334 RepID=UPI001E274A4E|nr:phosphopantothenoylcysteine decarboxylase [Melitaea cinxia]